MTYPKVTIITPTANRPHMLKRCIEQFLSQDYPGEKEMIVVANGELDIPKVNIFEWGRLGIYIRHQVGSISDKLNEACFLAKGEIILRFDDDDFYAPDWVTKSVQFLIDSKADITGLSSAYFYKPNSSLFDYSYTGEMAYVLGATMCFWERTWEKSKKKFYAMSYVHGKLVGEDKYFCVNNGLVKAHDYKMGFMAMLHGGNTSSQFVTRNPYAKPADISIVNQILNAKGQPVI